MRRTVLAALLCAGLVAGPVSVRAHEADELAKKLNNPISDLVSVPLQFNWEFGYGTDEDMREITILQPGVFVVSPPGGPEWKIRSVVTLMLPTKK